MTFSPAAVFTSGRRVFPLISDHDTKTKNFLESNHRSYRVGERESRGGQRMPAAMTHLEDQLHSHNLVRRLGHTFTGEGEGGDKKIGVNRPFK